jgi:hypothetical protein
MQEIIRWFQNPKEIRKINWKEFSYNDEEERTNLESIGNNLYYLYARRKKDNRYMKVALVKIK